MEVAPPNAVRILFEAMRTPGQPAAFYGVLKELLAENVGFQFVTIFVIDGGETLRVFSTEPRLYPEGERKPMAATDWGDHVLRQQRSFLANDAEAVKRTFFDHERIASLGCGSVMSVPVVYDGRCLGVINLNHREHFYSDDHIQKVEAIAPTLAPIFLDTVQRLRHGA